MVVSAALIREENKVQLPVYYVSQAFQRAEARYSRMKKIVFALIVASQKILSLLLGQPHFGDDGPTYKESNEQAQSSREVSTMGN